MEHGSGGSEAHGSEVDGSGPQRDPTSVGSRPERSASGEQGGVAPADAGALDDSGRAAAGVERWCRERLGEFPETLADCVRRGELWGLARSDAGELALELGLGAADAAALADGFRLARALLATRREARTAVRSPRAVFELFEAELRGLERETFHALALDGKHGVVRRYLVSVGTLTTSLVHPREVFRPALRFGAVSVVVVHNHPSGDPEPSAEDEEVTLRLAQAGRLLGVPLLDHVVVGEQRFVSLAERLGLGDARYRGGGERS